MHSFTRVVGRGLVLLGVAPAALAQEAEEIVVVTASRTAQTIASAPAAVTVLTDVDIARTPADDMGDLLRNVPGMNVSQLSARDINVTGRGSTNTLAYSQIALLDGRSTYLDFFGITMWDLLPIQTSEIDQIEVVRGPGSALYGANAMSGVVNVITKRPHDMTGTTVVVGTEVANIVHASGDEDFAYKVSAGYLEEDAYPRPTGTIPGTTESYPNFANEGSEQKRLNARLDWGLGDDSYVTVGAGMAETDGIMHSGIGPFDINQGADLSYAQGDWYRGGLHVGLSVQMLDGDATNLLTLGANGQPLGFKFVNDTYNLDVSNTNEFGERHVLTYGATLRSHEFELEIAPQADSKDEAGIFIQDDISLTENLRWVIGARYDDIDPLSDTVLTPRTSLIYSLSSSSSVRFSYNEAFRTPSTTNSYLNVTILQPLGSTGLVAPADAVGNINLVEESLEAYEVGYVGNLPNGMNVTVSAYQNETTDSIDFYVSQYYGPGNLPTQRPEWPPGFANCFNFPPGTAPPCGPTQGLAGLVPSDYSYRNIGKTVDVGLELSAEQDLGDWYWWGNVSWQDEPDVEGVNPIDVNVAPEWRANLGAGQDFDRFFWNANVNYQDEAYWSDVLNYRATTDAFTQVNASIGWRFSDEKLTLQVTAQNLFDEDVQQHIFGDIIERRVEGTVSFSF